MSNKSLTKCTRARSLGSLPSSIVCRAPTVRALTNCYCTSLSKEHLESVLKQFPDIAKKFSVIASRRFQQYLERSDPIKLTAAPSATTLHSQQVQLTQRSRNGSAIDASAAVSGTGSVVDSDSGAAVESPSAVQNALADPPSVAQQEGH
eukprot:Opistho-2@23572